MPEPSRPLSIGEQIAFYRGQLGLTQQDLAQRVGRSRGWVQNIEQGRRQIDSTSMILDLAEALGVEPDRLTSKPLFPPPKSPDMPRGNVLLDLRRALLHYDGIHGYDRSDDRPPRPVAELEREVQVAGETRRRESKNFSTVVWVLPGLIRDTRHAARHAQEDSGERRAAWSVLARLYGLAAALLWQYGDDDLGWIAADRSIRTAEQADSPLLVAASARVMQQLLLAQGDLDSVIDLTESAGQLIAPGKDAPPEQLIIWGNLQLIGAFAAARAKDFREHARLHDLSEHAAERLGEDSMYLGFNFGPGDVALQHVGELVELEQPTKALRLAEELPDDPLPQVDRRAFHRIHKARAQYLRHRDRETTDLLMEAWQIAPELVPYEPMTFEMIRAMLARARYRTNPNLRTLGERVGLI